MIVFFDISKHQHNDEELGPLKCQAYWFMFELTGDTIIKECPNKVTHAIALIFDEIVYHTCEAHKHEYMSKFDGSLEPLEAHVTYEA